MLPSFSLQRAKIHGFQDLFETESAGKLWKTHSVGCRRGKAFAKIVKAKSLRQKDGEHRTMPVFPSSLFLSIVF
jgi:hypothetical protein